MLTLITMVIFSPLFYTAEKYDAGEGKTKGWGSIQERARLILGRGALKPCCAASPSWDGGCSFSVSVNGL